MISGENPADSQSSERCQNYSFVSSVTLSIFLSIFTSTKEVMFLIPIKPIRLLHYTLQNAFEIKNRDELERINKVAVHRVPS